MFFTLFYVFVCNAEQLISLEWNDAEWRRPILTSVTFFCTVTVTFFLREMSDCIPQHFYKLDMKKNVGSILFRVQFNAFNHRSQL